MSGVCGGGCPDGQTNCEGTCVDLQTNRSNCGRCNNECKGQARSCVAGLCAGL
jgi:hypothetical protein